MSLPQQLMTDALAAIRQAAQITNHDDLRQAVLDDVVNEIAQQLHRAAAAHLGDVAPAWGTVSMQAQAVFLSRAKAIVAEQSALMRYRAQATTLERVEREIEKLSDDVLLASDRYLVQHGIQIALSEHSRSLVREYDGGRR